MKKIVIVGPESTGKTTITQLLAAHYQSPIVDEFARSYIDQLNRPYQLADLLKIARGQIDNEESVVNSSSAWLFCDTDLRVIKVWSYFKFGVVHPWVLDQIKERTYQAYLLMDIDLPWKPDPQREHPHQRRAIFERYHSEIKSSGVPYKIISGTEQARLQHAIDFISHLS